MCVCECKWLYEVACREMNCQRCMCLTVCLCAFLSAGLLGVCQQHLELGSKSVRPRAAITMGQRWMVYVCVCVCVCVCVFVDVCQEEGVSERQREWDTETEREKKNVLGFFCKHSGLLYRIYSKNNSSLVYRLTTGQLTQLASLNHSVIFSWCNKSLSVQRTKSDKSQSVRVC